MHLIAESNGHGCHIDAVSLSIFLDRKVKETQPQLLMIINRNQVYARFSVEERCILGRVSL